MTLLEPLKTIHSFLTCKVMGDHDDTLTNLFQRLPHLSIDMKEPLSNIIKTDKSLSNLRAIDKETITWSFADDNGDSFDIYLSLKSMLPKMQVQVHTNISSREDGFHREYMLNRCLVHVITVIAGEHLHLMVTSPVPQYGGQVSLYSVVPEQFDMGYDNHFHLLSQSEISRDIFNLSTTSTELLMEILRKRGDSELACYNQFVALEPTVIEISPDGPYGLIRVLTVSRDELRPYTLLKP